MGSRRRLGEDRNGEDGSDNDSTRNTRKPRNTLMKKNALLFVSFVIFAGIAYVDRFASFVVPTTPSHRAERTAGDFGVVANARFASALTASACFRLPNIVFSRAASA